MPNDDVKLVMLGQSGVGKSSLFGRLKGRSFEPYTDSTLGAAYSTVAAHEDEYGEVELDGDGGGKRWRVGIWDTAGQERYRALLPMYFRGANIVVAVHDGTEPSIQAARDAIEEVRDKYPEAGQVLGVCQNKGDLRPFDEAVAESFGADHVGYTSAKTNDGVEGFFTDLIQMWVDRHRQDRVARSMAHIQPVDAPPARARCGGC